MSLRFDPLVHDLAERPCLETFHRILATAPQLVTTRFVGYLLSSGVPMGRLVASRTGSASEDVRAPLTALVEELLHAERQPEWTSTLVEQLRARGAHLAPLGATRTDLDASAVALSSAVGDLVATVRPNDAERARTATFSLAQWVVDTVAEGLFESSTTEATVVEVHRLGRDLVVVRLEAEAPLSYAAGDALWVSLPQAPGRWRRFSPTMPPTPDGRVEFFLREVGLVTRMACAATQPGDRWQLGAPEVALSPLNPAEPHVIVAAGTGIAPVRALLLDWVAQSSRSGATAPAPVHLVYAARFSGAMYWADGIAALHHLHPWFTAELAVEREDPWWMSNPPELPPSVPLTKGDALTVAARALRRLRPDPLTASLSDLAHWRDPHVVVVGPPPLTSAAHHRAAQLFPDSDVITA